MSLPRGDLLFVDGEAGASGDMLLGAFVDLGLPAARLRRELEALGVDGWRLRSRRLERAGIVGRKIDVKVATDSHGRRWSAIRKILRGGALTPRVRDAALAVFGRLFEAEAEVHGKSVETIHLHEAGAVDAIVDIVGSCIALDLLGWPTLVASTLTTGSGTVVCAHGVMPVPAPATLALCRGVPIHAGSIAVERLTPTGAAILTTLAARFEPMPALIPVAEGYGCGTRDLGRHPNMLRMVLGRSLGGEQGQAEVAVASCQIDDATPQELAHVCARLLDDGALDVWQTPVVMKKGRSGVALSVVARPDAIGAAIATLLAQTPTLGVRTRLERRVELERKSRSVATPYGKIPIKVATLDEGVKAWPEYEACRRAAERHGVALREVQQAALTAWRTTGDER